MALLNRRLTTASILLLTLTLTVIFLRTERGAGFVDNVNQGVVQPVIDKVSGTEKEPEKPHPVFKPVPSYTPPPVKDNFPLLATSKTAPPIPSWNVPKKDVHKKYNLTVPPPLLIGFTRTWPILQQAVVSYITAGWPPEQIYVIENTGVQRANANGQLSLQNPFFLNYTSLAKLGVNVVQAPVLMSFAQMQNFFLSLSYQFEWPYYFWSHMDVLALSYEDGHDGLTGKYNDKDYRSLYELGLHHLNKAIVEDERWGVRFFAYDHLALVNPVAYEDVGGWDTQIPFYMTDCDMHSRLLMRKWSMNDARAGIITDVNTALSDLSALYREKTIVPDFTDPNPPPPPPPEKKARQWFRRSPPANPEPEVRRRLPDAPSVAYPAFERRDGEEPEDPNIKYWRSLLSKADHMFHYKHGGSRGRNTWQLGQQGGKGEPYYYPAVGIAESIEIHTEAGKEVYRKKWGHRDCGLIEGAGLKIEDQWLVEQDWKN